MALSLPADQLKPFGPAISQAAVHVASESYPSEYVKTSILELSNYLIALAETSALFNKPTYDRFSVSLKTLYDRLQNGYLTPSPLHGNDNEESKIKQQIYQRTGKAPMVRPLEDFEHLYYAVLAYMQEIHHVLRARLGSGFSTSADQVAAGGPTIVELNETLSQYWDMFNDPAYVKTLDNAIRRSRVKHLHQEILAQAQVNDITQRDAEELLADLYDPGEYDGIQGLSWIGGWAPAMIGAWLEEKYRVVLQAEKEDEKKKAMAERRQSRVGRKRATMDGTQKIESQPRTSTDRNRHHIDEHLQAPQEQQDAENQDKTVQHALGWRMKMERVQEYSQYLRGMASEDAMWEAENCMDNDLAWEC